MQDTYGIFTTDGEIVAGSLNDEYAVNLAEMLDESTASLYISTKNGTFLMGTAVNVQKKGRRPDTVIYLEKSGYDTYMVPHIDLAYVQEFYGRVRRTLEKNDYEVRNLASDDSFFDERNMRLTSGMSGTDTANYAVGRLIMGKDVIAVSDNLSKSVDFAVSVAGKMMTYMAAGFTIVVAKRSFRDADLMVIEKVSGGSQINLATETVTGGNFSDIYGYIGKFAQNPSVMREFSGREPLNKITEKILAEFERTQRISPQGKKRYAEFLETEITNKSFSEQPRKFSSENYADVSRRSDSKFDSSGYESKWEVNSFDRDKAQIEYEKHMEKKHKGRLMLISGVVVIFVILAAVFVFAFNPSFLNNKADDPNHFIPSEPIPTPTPNPENYVVIILNAGNYEIPQEYYILGSRLYNVTMSETPQLVSLPVDQNLLTRESHGDILLMRLDTATDRWLPSGNVENVNPDDVWVNLTESGIYGMFNHINPESYVTGVPPFSEPNPQSPQNVQTNNNGM